MTLFAIKLDTGKAIKLTECVTKPNKAGQSHGYLGITDTGANFVQTWGVNVPMSTIGGKLPSKAELFVNDGSGWVPTGNVVALTKGETKPNPKTGKGGGNPKVEGTFPNPVEFDGAEQTLVVRFSQTKTGMANTFARSSRGKVGSIDLLDI